MNDSEKVIRGLEALDKSMHENQCYACSHEFIQTAEEFGTVIVADALELLKKHKPIEPDSEHHSFICPMCKTVLKREQKYCHECGQAVKWE